MAGRIRLCGRLMQLMTLVIAAIVAVAAFYVCWVASADPGGLDRLLSGYLVEGRMQLAFGPSALGALALIALANLGIMAAGFYCVWRIGDVFARGDVFALDCGRWLRRLGVVSLAGAISTVISRTLSIALATTVPDGGQLLVIGVGTNEAFLLLAALMLLVLGHVMVLATAIDAENRSFV